VETNRLIAKLTDPDEDVRAEAREELSMRMDDEIARAYLDIAASDAGEEIRGDVIVGLGPIIEEAGMDYAVEEFELVPEFGPGISRETFESIVNEVRAIYEDEAQPKLVRRRALEVLVRDPQPWQAAEIRRLFASEDEQWKLTAIFAMGHVEGFGSEIAAVVGSEKGLFLYEAVRAAGRMEVEAAAKRIRQIALSESAETELRLVAIEALPGVDRDCEEVLQELLESDDEEIVVAAEDALDELTLALSLDEEDFDDDELDLEDDDLDDDDDEDED
jgi:hypothetical protein